MSYSFPAYSGDEPRCEKCCYEGASTTYVKTPEALERECRRCGYTWLESVMSDCTCGQPSAGVNHRADGPCYLEVR